MINFQRLKLANEKESEWNKIGEGGQCNVYLTSYLGIEVVVKKFKSQVDSLDFEKEIKTLG